MAVIADGELLPEASAALRAVYGHRVGTGAGRYAQDIVVITPARQRDWSSTASWSWNRRPC